MNINTHAKDFELTRALDRAVRDRMRRALSRIDENVIAVDVYLKDTNGPKGGMDKHVLIRIFLRSRRTITVETRRDDLYAAIEVGAKRTKRAVRRHLRRSRHVEARRLRELLGDEVSGGAFRNANWG